MPFAERKYAGNQLAVITAADGLDGDTMQAIAREMNFSETTFVLGPGEGTAAFRVRIFTPAEEVPFAGHPPRTALRAVRPR
jgi:trans-2,3-dihydro-3-hydroxyanthranilate isomerase